MNKPGNRYQYCSTTGLLVGLFLMTGCSNIVRSGLVNDTSILLPPSAARTIYVHIRNTSENQGATPSDISARLSAKGYQVVKDPLEAAYWLQTQVVYCHKAGDGVRPETVAKAGFGAGIGSGGTPLANAGGLDMDAMSGMFGGMAGSGMNVQAMRGMAMGRRGDARHQCHDADGDERPRRLSGNDTAATERGHYVSLRGGRVGH